MADQWLRTVAVVLLALLLLPVVAMLVAMPMMWGMMGGVGMMDGPVGLVMWLVPLVVVLALGYAVYSLLAGRERRDPAVEELREAYARGELTTEEFDERMEQLEE